MNNKTISLLDLYSGLGGLSIGFEMTGAYRILAGIDNYDWAVKAFYLNHPNIKIDELKQPLDLSTFTPKQLHDALGEKPDVIAGGPPCQGFSHAGSRLDDLMDDPRNHQVFHFYEHIKYMRPKVFLMENVAGIASTGQKKKNLLLDMLKKSYSEEGYNVSWKILNSSHFRVPQVRKRLFLVGILDSDVPFQFPSPISGQESTLFNDSEAILTSEDAIGDLPTPDNSEPQNYTAESSTALQAFLREGSNHIFNHLPTKHSPEMIQKLKEQKIGTRLYDWNHSWYRLDPNRPAPTIKQNNRAPGIHYSEPRSISPRECARLQTLPDRFVIPGTKTAQLIMLGNAVPSIFAAHLATAISDQVFKNYIPQRWDEKSSPLMKY